MNLKELLYRIALVQVNGSTDVEITGVALDSRAVTSGNLFVALKGALSDGHSFTSAAIEKGASAVLVEDMPEEPVSGITWIAVADSHEALGRIAANFYHQPTSKIKVVGVTGTNGKTTCATLLYKLFTRLGFRCGLISSIENRVVDQVAASRLTTPDVLSLNRLFCEMIEQEVTHCFMEVSSHAVVQRRISGIEFTGGIFTNITHDHLDFHKTFAAYIQAKKMFFDGLSRSAFALTNLDDKNGQVMLQNTLARKKTYSLKSVADFKGRMLENHFKGMLLNVDEVDVWFKLVGAFNASNILAVYGAAMLLEIDKREVLTVLSSLTGAEGRFDYVSAGASVTGIVDYAHTPDAVKNVLETIVDIKSFDSEIITVVGCGGDRDKTKRPEMARIATRYSNCVILTSDNPRSEDPEAILDDMEAGVSAFDKEKVRRIADRTAAIRAACLAARPGDVILLAGKGHEKYQEVEGVRYPFDDKQILLEELTKLAR